MAGFKGNNLLLYMATSGTATPAAEDYVKVAALRGTSYTINKSTIDANNKDSGAWNVLVEGGGLKTFSITADGVWLGNNQASGHHGRLMRAAGFNVNQGALVNDTVTTHWNFQIVDEAGFTLTGRFNVDSFSRTGELNGLDTWTITLTSSGTVTWAEPVAP